MSSRVIDDRILSMEFDNKQFEAGVQQSLSTLDKLKSSLNLEGAAKGLENVAAAAKGADVSGIGDGIETVKAKFSALQVIGVTALSELTKTAMNLGKSLYDSTLGQIISGGRTRALNMEQARFSLQGLKYDADQIKQIMGQASKSVDGTAYGMDVAAKAASQVLASGIQVGDQLDSVLRGIAGVAAQTNTDYQSVSQIFTKVAGNGKMMGEELRQLSGYGMNAAATIAEYGFETKKTEAEVRELATKGKISADIFFTAMDKAFGENATKANETYTGSLANVKAQLSKMGELFLAPHMEGMKAIFNGLIPVEKKFKDALIPLATKYGEIWVGFGNYIKDMLVDTDELGKMTSKISFHKLEDFLGRFSKAHILENIAKTLMYTGAAISQVFRAIYGAISETFGGITLWSVKMFTEAMASFAQKLIMSDETMQKLKRTLKGPLAILGIFTDILGTTLKAIGKGLGYIFKSFSGAKVGVLDFTASIGDQLVTFREWLKNGDYIWKVFETIGKILKPVIDIIAKGTLAITGFIYEHKLLEKAANLIGTVFSFVYEKISKFVTAARENEKVIAIWEALKTVASSLWDAIKDWAPEVLDKIIEFFNTLKEQDNLTFDGIKGAFEGLKETIKSGVADMMSSFDGLQPIFDMLGGKIDLQNAIPTLSTIFSGPGAGIDALKGLAGKLGLFGKETQDDLSGTSSGLDKIAGGFKSVGESFTKFVGPMDLQKALNLGLQGVSIKSLWDLSKAFKSFSGFGDSLKNMFSGIAKAFTGLNEAFSGFAFNQRAKAFRNIAMAILILVGALFVLTKIDQEALQSAMKTLLQLAGILTGMIATMTLAEKFSGGGGKGGALALLAAGTSLLMLVLMLKSIAKLDPASIQPAMSVMWQLVGMLIALVALTSVGIGTKDGGSFGMGSSGWSLLAAATSLFLLVIALKAIEMLNPEKIPGSLGIMGILVSMLIGLMLTSALAQKIAGKGTAAIKGLIAAAGALLIMVFALKALEFVKPETLWNSIKAMGVMVIMLGGLLLASCKAGQYSKEAGKMLIQASAAMLLMTAVIFITGMMSMAMIGKGLLVLFAMTGFLAGLLLVSKNAAFVDMKNLFKLVLVTAILALAVGGISLLDPLAVFAGIVAISALLAAVGLMVKLASEAKIDMKEMLKISAVLLILVGIVGLVSLIANENTLSAVGALSILLVALTGAVWVLSGIEGTISKGTMGSITILAVILCGICALMALINKFIGDFSLGIETAASLSLLMGTLAGVAFALSSCPGDFMSGVETIGVMVAFIIAFVGVVALLGWLAGYEGFKTLINRGIPMLIRIAQGIGEVIGALISGLLVGVTDTVGLSLERMGKYLSNMAENMKPFLEIVKTIGWEHIRGVAALSALLLMITGEELARGLMDMGSRILNFGKSGLRSFTDGITNLAKGMVKYSNIADGISKDGSDKLLKATIPLIQVISMINTHVVTGGIASPWVQFVNELVPLANAMVEYCTSASKIPKDLPAKSLLFTTCLLQIVAVIKALAPYQSMVQGDGFDSTPWGNFIESLEELSKKLPPFNATLSNLPTDIVANSVRLKSVLLNLTDIVNELAPAQSMLEGGTFNSTPWVTFIDSLGEIALKLPDYLASISGLTNNQETQSGVLAGILGGLADVVVKLAPSKDAILQVNEGSINIVTSPWLTFIGSLQDIAAVLPGYLDAIKGLTPAKEEQALQLSFILSDLADVAAKIAENPEAFYKVNLGQIVLVQSAWIDFINSLGTIAEVLPDFLAAIEKVPDGIDTKTDNLTKALKAICDLASNLPPEVLRDTGFFAGVKAIVFGFGSGKSDLQEFTEGLRGFALAADLFGQTLNNCTNIDNLPNKSKSLVQALSPIIDMATKLKDIHEVIRDRFWHNSDISEFFTSMGDLATQLKQENGLYNVLNSMNMYSFKAQATSLGETLNVFVNMANGLGAGNDFQNIKELLDVLNSTAPDFLGLKDTLAGISKSSVVDDARALKTAMNLLSEIGSGNTDLYSLGSGIERMGEGLKNFVGSTADIGNIDVTHIKKVLSDINEIVASIDPEKFTSAGEVLRTALKTGLTEGFGEVQSSLGEKLGDVTTLITSYGSTYNTSGKTLGTSFIGGLSSGFSEKASGLTTSISEALNGALMNAGLYNTRFNTTGLTLSTALQSGITTKLGEIQGFITTTLSNVLIAMSFYVRSFSSTGTALNTALKEGLSSSDIGTKLVSTLGEANTNMRMKYQSFYDTGQYLVEGLAEGMKAKKWKVSEQAVSAVTEAYNAANRKAKNSSPSKLFMDVGSWMGEGLAVGIFNMIPTVAQTSADMVTEAHDGVSNVISKITDMLSDDIEYQPTITPVLDLSDIQNGVSNINGMFGSDYALAMAGNINYSGNDQSISDMITSAVNSAIDAYKKSQDPINLTIENNMTLEADGKVLAKTSAPYLQPELDKLINQKLRLEGVR